MNNEKCKSKEKVYSLENVVSSPIFMKHLQDMIHCLDPKFKPIPPAGYQFKRCAQDTLFEKGLMTAEFFASEFLKISNKNSTLSKAERAFILIKCIPIAYETSREMIINDHNKEITRLTTKLNKLDPESAEFIKLSEQIKERQQIIQIIQIQGKKQ